MTTTLHKSKPDFYTVTESPLTAPDKEKLKKDSGIYFKVNLLLIPLLLLIFFWGLLYFVIFGALVFMWNLYAIRQQRLAEKNAGFHKVIFTGSVTRIEKFSSGDGYDTIVWLGEEAFNITYSNDCPAIIAGAMISLHYSQNERGERKILLAVDV